MKKKLVKAMAAAMSMVLLTGATGVTALAGGFDESANQTDKQVQSNDDDVSTDIPVYGYVGEDKTIIDPDPSNPNGRPQPDTDIHVSVPVKLIWAAFESDGGAISSPDYYIKNHSAHMDIVLSISSFEPRITDANTLIDPDLTLTIKEIDGKVQSLDVFAAGASALPTAGVELGRLLAGKTYNFSLGGSYVGSFSALSEYQMPEYDFVLKFAQDK